MREEDISKVYNFVFRFFYKQIGVCVCFFLIEFYFFPNILLAIRVDIQKQKTQQTKRTPVNVILLQTIKISIFISL